LKGFAATPIIFIAVFLITAMLFLHFMDIDKQVAEGVGKEARLRKLQADALKNQTAGVTELHSCMLWAAQFSSDEATLEKNMKDCLGGRSADAHAFSNGFSADYKTDYNASTLIDADLNMTLTISERINYPFFELRNIVSNYKREPTYDSNCTKLMEDVYSYTSTTFADTNLGWGYTNTTCLYDEDFGRNITYTALENWYKGTLSESYHHRTGLYGGACNCP